MFDLSLKDVFDKAKEGTRGDAGIALLGLSAGYFGELLMAAHGHSLSGLTAGAASVYISTGVLGLKQLLTKGASAPSSAKALPAPADAAKALPAPGYVEEDEKQMKLIVSYLHKCVEQNPAATYPATQAEAKLSRDLTFFQNGVIKREQWQASIDAALKILDSSPCV